ncbi:MAG: hypothetical protein AAGF90_21690, partial [Pseudomonadota bacterium]
GAARAAEAGAPLRDQAGRAAALRAFLAAERRVASVELHDRDGAVVFGLGRDDADAVGLARIAEPIGRRFDPIGAVVASYEVARSPTARGALHPLAAAAGAAALAIGLIHLLFVVEPAGLRGLAGARAWALAAAAPAAAIGFWLAAASGEAYRDQARVVSDIVADRLRAAVEIGLDPADFSGLGALLREAAPEAARTGPAFAVTLVEGRKAIARAGADLAVGAPALVDPGAEGALSLAAGRTIRPRSLEEPALSVVAAASRLDVAAAAPGDHPWASAALALFWFAPAAGLALLRRSAA